MREFFDTRGVFCLRNLTVMAMLLALRVILGYFTIQPVPQFRFFSFTFIPTAMVAFLYGPWAALAFGLMGDTLGFLTRPMGVFFIGFTISEMLTCFIYSCFTYKRPVDNLRRLIIRVALARLCIALFIFFGLNFLWFRIGLHIFAPEAPAILTTPFGYFILQGRLLNNLLQFPLYVALSVFFIRLARKLEDSRTLHPRGG